MDLKGEVLYMTREIMLKGRKIKYELIYKHVKNINIRINSEDDIKVSASRHVSPEYIERLLEERSDFITEAISRSAELRKRRKGTEYCEGSDVYYLGAPYILRVVTDHNEKTGISEGILTVCSGNDSVSIEKEVKKWYDSVMHEVFGPVERSTAERFAEYVSFVPEYTYRYMKSIWGSCNRNRKRITINKNLLRYDRALIEFVYCHEYVHFIYPDHSADFYRLFSEIMPDHMERRRKLKEASEKY